MDNWDSFVTAFAMDKTLTGKAHMLGIEGNNCRLRNLVRGLFGKRAAFPKSSLIISGSLIWSFSISIMASFEAYHTL
jgi:IS1 family transposase